jgi:glycosyltransferase involved in cell wall biosynthesis
MRIGITMLSHDPTWGGIGIYTREIVHHLLEIDFDNEYVLIYPGFGNARNNRGQYERVHPNCTEIETRKSLSWGTYWDQLVLPSVAREHKLDLLFNPFWSVPVLAKYKTVMVVHNTEFHTIPNVYDFRRRVEWTLHNYIWVHRADAVISISDVITEDLVKYVHLPRERIRRIYHGCSERFKVINDVSLLDPVKRKHNLPDKFLLYVGMIFPQKNFISLARAFHKIYQNIPHDIVVVGQPRWKYQEDKKLIETLGLRDRIRFLHFVPNEEMPMIYNLADCFVYPSLYEGFGLAGVEAMACGCPMAAANAAAIPEVADGAAVLFDPYSPQEIADSIMTLLHDEQIRETCIRRGLERAKAFTWERTARDTLQLFRDLVEAGQQPRE